MLSSPRSPNLYNHFSQGRLLRFKKGQVIATTADINTIMLVVKGYIKRYSISNKGSLGVQIIYGPQDLFSLTKIYDLLLGQSLYDGPEVYYYETLCDARLYTLDADTLSLAIQQNPLLYKELFSEAGQHLNTCVHSIENISLGGMYQRVAHQLWFCAKKFGKKGREGTQLAVPVTHQDIADMLGATRETVTKAIVQLRAEGLVGDGRQFSVLDMQGLEQVAYQ